MGTGNFASGNSDRLFAAEIEDEMDYEDLVCNLRSELKAAAERNTFDTYEKDDSEEADSNRSYYGKVIAKITGKSKKYKRLGFFYLKFGIIVRSGYYSGVNLECEVVNDCTGECIRHDEDIVLSDYYFDLTNKQLSMYNKFVNDWKEKEINLMVEQIDKILSENSTELNVVARFSNGEVMYEEK